MNKSITVVLLLVVLAAMGLVMYAHTSGENRQTVLQADAEPLPAAFPPLGATSSPLPGKASTLEAPQGDKGGLERIDPPLSNRDGIPKPVSLTPGSDGRPVRPPEQYPPVREPVRERPLPPSASPPSAPPAMPSPSLAPPPSAPPSAPPSVSPATSTGAQRTPEKSASSLRSAATSDSATTASAQDSADRQPAAPEAPDTPESGPPGLTPCTTPPGESANQKPAARKDSAPQTQAKPREAEKTVALSDKATHVLQNIAFSFAGQNLQLVIQADTPFPCKTFVLTGPDRLVIDLPGAWKEMKTPAIPQNRLVKNVRVGTQAAGPRLVLALHTPLKRHGVERAGSSVTVQLQ